MAAEQYCLKWNNHQSTLLVNFEALLESNALTDCTLSADGKYLDVHRVVLSACSPYFYKLFGEHREKHPIFFMKDTTYDELKGIVDYMYKGEVNIDQDKIESFLSVAKSLQIKGLADEDSGSAAKEDDEGLPRSKRKPPDLDSPLPEDSAPRSPKRKRRTRPPSQESDQNNHCDNYQQPAPQPEITMPTPMIPIKKTEPLESHSGYPQVQLKTEQIDEPQDDVQDLTLDDDEEEYGGEETQPGTSFSESSQDMKWFQQMTNQSASLGDDSFMATASTQQNVSNNTGTPGAQVSRSSGVLPISDVQTFNNFFKEFKAFKEKISGELLQINSLLNQRKNFSSVMLADGQYESAVNKLRQFVFPFETVNGLWEFSTFCQDPDNQPVVISFLASIGGHTIEKAVDLCMSKLLSPTLSNMFSLTGKKSKGHPGKLAFKSFNLIDIILRSLKAGCHKEATCSAVEIALKRYFARVGDRFGGRERRKLFSLAAASVSAGYSTQQNIFSLAAASLSEGTSAQKNLFSLGDVSSSEGNSTQS